MISYYDIPFIVSLKAGIKNKNEFDELIAKECGEDEEKQHEFMIKWIKDWLQANNLRLVLAEIWDESEMAEFMNFAADYIEAFDFSLQDMIFDHAYNIGGKEIESAQQKMLGASINDDGQGNKEDNETDSHEGSLDEILEDNKTANIKKIRELTESLTEEQVSYLCEDFLIEKTGDLVEDIYRVLMQDAIDWQEPIEAKTSIMEEYIQDNFK